MRCRSRALGSSTLQLPPKTLTPSQNASKSVQIADRSASQQNMYEEDDLRLPPSTGSIIVATAVGSSVNKLVLCSRSYLHTTGSLHRTKLDFRECPVSETE